MYSENGSVTILTELLKCYEGTRNTANKIERIELVSVSAGGKVTTWKTQRAKERLKESFIIACVLAQTQTGHTGDVIDQIVRMFQYADSQIKFQKGQFGKEDFEHVKSFYLELI